MMRGTMVWFNEEKGHGYISTEAGERLYVSQQGFADGIAPKGRCAGLPVEFEIATNIEGRDEAVGSVLVEDPMPPRARRRHRAGR
jgi:cold shock CspA family protein